jgi:plastocyanin
MGKTAVIAVVVIILAVAGGAFALTRKNSPKTSTPATIAQTLSETTTKTPLASTETQTAGTITYTDNGFSPATLTVKSGTVVTIKNSSSSLLQFDSDPHPVHTDDPELNIGVIAPGQSKTITVTQTGTHGYHNHSNPDDTGTLIVQ